MQNLVDHLLILVYHSLMIKESIVTWWNDLNGRQCFDALRVNRELFQSDLDAKYAAWMNAGYPTTHSPTNDSVLDQLVSSIRAFCIHHNYPQPTRI
jgi:hypothetical protein